MAMHLKVYESVNIRFVPNAVGGEERDGYRITRLWRVDDPGSTSNPTYEVEVEDVGEDYFDGEVHMKLGEM